MKKKQPENVISFPSVLAFPYAFSLIIVLKHGRWRRKYLPKLWYCKYIKMFKRTSGLLITRKDSADNP